jgi:DNA polymerase III epsilon subunit-like protein
MAIKKEIVNGGKKIILRHTSGAEKGKLAGSVSIDPSVVPSSKKLDLPPVPQESNSTEATGDSISKAYEKFLRADAERDVIEASDDFTTVKGGPVNELAQRISAIAPTGLDEDQHTNVFDALTRSVKRWNPAPETPTEEEWNVTLLTARARITDPENGLSEEERENALKVWEAAKAAGIPDGYTHALLSSSESRMWKAKYALDEHSLQIASWIDADPELVKAKVSEYRAEYYTKIQAGEDVSIPTQYEKGWSRTAGSAPRDKATAYAHWKAENPELYPATHKPKRYVALDLETTGLSTREDHIIEIGFVEYDAKGKEIGRWGQLVCPPPNENGEITTGGPEVEAIHGIKVKDVIGKPTFDQVLPEIHKRLEGATVIGHNLGFDTKHLRASFRKYAGDSPELSNHTWTGEVDTLFHASRHMEGLENNKLVTVSGSLGIPYTNGHRAVHDAAVSGEVFFKLRKRLKNKQPKS